MNRLVQSMAYAAGLTVVIAAVAFIGHLVGMPFANTTVPIINLFLLLLVLVQKEMNRREIVEEVRGEKEMIRDIARGYEALMTSHKQTAERTLNQVMGAADEIRQKVDDVVAAPAAWKPGDADRRKPDAG